VDSGALSSDFGEVIGGSSLSTSETPAGGSEVSTSEPPAGRSEVSTSEQPAGESEELTAKPPATTSRPRSWEDLWRILGRSLGESWGARGFVAVFHSVNLSETNRQKTYGLWA